jgi:membrane protease YdiL (CAAX protease family)
MLAVMLIIVNPVCEEFLWRGYSLARLEARFGAPAAIAISSLGYAGYHWITAGSLFSWGAGAALAVVVFAAGVFWAVWRRKAQSILPTVVSHLLADAGILAAYAAIILPMAQPWL